MLKLGRGASIKEYCGRDAVNINWVCKGVKACLEYAHSEGWCHLDVQPSNVIVEPDLGNSPEQDIVKLIDWGSAAMMKEKLDHYRGTPPFSHPNLLRLDKKDWVKNNPKADFDMYSLAMTACYLLRGRMPWDGFDRVHVTQEMLDSRLEIAKPLIDQSNLDEDLKVFLISVIDDSLPRQSKRLKEKLEGKKDVTKEKRAVEDQEPSSKNSKKMMRRTSQGGGRAGKSG